MPENAGLADSLHVASYTEFKPVWIHSHGGLTSSVAADGSIYTARVIIDSAITIDLKKIDPTGRTLWRKSLSADSDTGDAYPIGNVSTLPLADGCFVVAYGEWNDVRGIRLARVDASGNVISESFIPDVQGWNAIVTGDGGCIVVGGTAARLAERSGGTEDEDPQLLRFSANGSLVWRRTYAMPGMQAVGYAVVPSSDGGFVLSGAIGSNGNQGETMLLIGVDANGAERWRKTYQLGNDDVGRSILPWKNGYLVLAGKSLGPGGQAHPDRMEILYVGAKGEKIWTKGFWAGDMYHPRLQAVGDSAMIVGMYGLASIDASDSIRTVGNIRAAAHDFSFSPATMTIAPDGSIVATGQQTSANQMGWWGAIMKLRHVPPRQEVRQ